MDDQSSHAIAILWACDKRLATCKTPAIDYYKVYQNTMAHEMRMAVELTVEQRFLMKTATMDIPLQL